MGKRSKKIVTAGLFISLLTTLLGPVHGGGNSAHAAASNNQSLAAAYARIQTENASQVVALVNKERIAAGLKPLIIHTNLTKMAKPKRSICTKTITSIIFPRNTARPST